MTSGASPEQVDAMATTVIDDDPPPNTHLTAIDHTEDAQGIAEQTPSTTTLPPQDNAVDLLGASGQNGQDEYADLHEGLMGVPPEPFDYIIPSVEALRNAVRMAEQDPMIQAHVARMRGTSQDIDSSDFTDMEASDPNIPLSIPDFNQAVNLAAIHKSGPDPFASNGLNMDPSHIIPQDLSENKPIKAYAKLVFADSTYYMTTYSMVIGRDFAASKATREQEQRVNDPLKTTESRSRGRNRYSKSIVSEAGGVVAVLEDSEEVGRQQKHRTRRKSKSSRSSSPNRSRSRRRSSAALPSGLPYSDTEAPRRVDPESLRPDPHSCPRLAIHPPAIYGSGGYKSISRNHVKIAYNEKKCQFEATMIGKNGVFVDDVLWDRNMVVPLKSGCNLQIGVVHFQFILPDVPIGQTGAEEPDYADESFQSEEILRFGANGKEMSLDFSQGHRDGVGPSTSDEESSGPDREEGESGEEEIEEEDLEGEDEDGEGSERLDFGGEDDEEGSEQDEPFLIRSFEGEGGRVHDEGEEEEEPIESPKIEKKRKVGRPPNGKISKREEKLAKQEAKKAAKSMNKKESKKDAKNEVSAQAEQSAVKNDLPPTAPVKKGVGRPRKYPLPTTPPPQREKRKYTKRKPREPKEGEVKQEGEAGDDQPMKEKKDKKLPKPPRSPSPTFVEAELTPEQLQKPSANYVTLIHEALQSSANGQMSLPQIYRAIQRKYPYFVLRTTTNGWQSSVRHNLSQHGAFKKIEREGKGWLWAVVEGATIESEKKKKRPTSPPNSAHGQMQHQMIYPGYPHMAQYGPPPPGMQGPPPGYQYPQMQPTFRPGQPQQYMGPPPPHMTGQFPPPGPQPFMNGHPPPGIVAAIAPITGGNAPTSYSSPYGPKPTQQNVPQSTEQQSNSERSPVLQNPQNPQNQSAAVIPQQNPYPPTSQYQHPPQQLLSPTQPYTSQPQTRPPQSENLQPQQAQPQQAQPQHSQPPPPQAVAPILQQQSNANASSSPVYDGNAVEAVGKFRTILIAQISKNEPNAEELVDSAIARVLKTGGHSNDPPSSEEQSIINALKSIINTVSGSNAHAPSSPLVKSLNTQDEHRSPPPQPQSQTNQSGTQAGASQQPSRSTGSEKPVPAVMRPSFTTQLQTRPNGSSVPRPPMNPHGKSNSSSSHAPPRLNASSASPAPTVHSPSGASTPKLSLSENSQVVGQKRPHDGSEDMQDFKRLAASGPPSLKA